MDIKIVKNTVIVDGKKYTYWRTYTTTDGKINWLACYKYKGRIEDDTVQPTQQIVPKGWGHEHWLVNNKLYCSKLLYVTKDKRCSYHYHKKKTETFYLQQGSIVLRYGYGDLDTATVLTLRQGQTFHIPRKLRHQFHAIEDSVIIETSTYHQDKDVVRISPGD